jgi:NADPH:quinone reductase-like Zn-dependent oxidoreductase
MALPKECRVFRRTTGPLPNTITASTEPLPSSLSAHEVLIQIHAVSLNYRDAAMLQGAYPVPVQDQGIPASDCAASVVAVGSEVKDFREGDYVAPIFNLGNVTGVEDEGNAALGGDAAGVLREYAVYEEKVLVKLPKHLSWEEVSMLSRCWSVLRF